MSGRPEEGAARWFAGSRDWADALISRRLDEMELGPPALEEAIRYAMTGGGKRVRPALCRLVGSAADGAERAIEAGAFAVECVHTYSLVHDDLPSMDDDDLRRGRATVHRRFDEATAVLVGDALQALAFEALAESGEGAALRVRALARAAGAAGMVGGQVLDLAAEGRSLSVEEVEAIHGAKTAALLGAAAELGALSGPEPLRSERAGPARALGEALGMCFQAMDDVLDVTGDAATLGKTPGKDAGSAKGTLVAALGLDGARGAAERHAERALGYVERLGVGALGAGFVSLLLSRNS
ncbi:MAG: polyprenyl synthetase family protein [Planctomycetota bacterium]|nr:polyprenyl synthetase family protein [Planctomycetota bacterium]